MHEATIAQSVLESIKAEAAKHNARPVSARISCGRFNAVNEDALCFAFSAIAKGTVCEQTKLEIEYKPIQGQCKKCSRVFDLDISRPICPACGSGDFELLPDTPLVLEEITFQTEQ